MTTDAKLTKIARDVFQGLAASESGRASYLQLLVAEVQDALGAPRRKNRAPASTVRKLEPSETDAQLKALGEVHAKFYETVLHVAGDYVPAGTRDRPTALHKRANFARTALSAVRRWVRAGNDITTLAAAKVSKRELAVLAPAGAVRQETAQTLKSRAATQSKSLVATLMGLADTDKEAAVEEMQLVLGQLTSQLISMGVAATKDAALALSDHRPLRIGKTLFLPTTSQVLKAA